MSKQPPKSKGYAQLNKFFAPKPKLWGENLLGQQFGQLLVLEKSKNKGKRTAWLCLCSCGVKKSIASEKLKAALTVSCGCLKKTKGTLARSYKHGMIANPLYWVWAGMVQRCTNPNSSKFKDYGARGIYIDLEWLHNPKAFVEWGIRNGYKSGLQIDRKNNNGPYSPSNCHWVTNQENQLNTRRTILINYENQNIPLIIAIKRSGSLVKYGTAYARRLAGKSTEEILGL